MSRFSEARHMILRDLRRAYHDNSHCTATTNAFSVLHKKNRRMGIAPRPAAMNRCELNPGQVHLPAVKPGLVPS